MSESLRQFIESATRDWPAIVADAEAIQERIIAESPYVDAANFQVIHPSDLKRLFDAYDETFFAGKIRSALAGAPLNFRFSRRMTSAGGKMTRKTKRDGSKSFEIAVSSTLLYNCFHGDDHRPITTNGIECRNRMEALQRVMEHEITHLVEDVVWNKSSCSRPRFQGICQRLFGHTEYTHALITHRERTYAQYGIHPGLVVRFHVDGAAQTGIVNRVTKRATVLVETDEGELYSDGKRYTKYYVPPRMLEIVR